MHDSPLLLNLIIFLTAAVVFVPLLKKLGLGSVLGYLIGGIVIGPHGFGFISEVEQVLSFSEFGIVLLLFIIGLELNPKKLWALRLPIFGLGGLQVLVNSSLIGLTAYALGCSPVVSTIIGMAFSLSSTAMALQILNERKLLSTSSGQAGFSILLFQDIAVIPMMAVLPLLASGTESLNAASAQKFGINAGVIVLTLVGGRYLLRPVLQFVASLHLREIFTAMSLLLVVAMAYLMHSLEVSMALGSFLAGVLLADSEYRHALETDIEPFKGLLLGLFFMAVGMSVNLATLIEKPLVVIGLVLLVPSIKTVVHYGLAWLFKIPRPQRPFFSLVISQVGEFAFVLLAAAAALQLLPKDINDLLLAVITLSMLLTPFVMLVYDKLHALFSSQKPAADVIENESNQVIIAGFGRYGQIIGRLLHANKIKATVLDYEPDQIELLRRFGFKVYYGDATRMDLLESAGIAQAKILIVAIDEVESNLKLARLARQNYPHLKIFARARNMQHVFDLMDAQVDVAERETFESSLKMGSQVLQSLGWSPYESVKAAHLFRSHNIDMIKNLHQLRNLEPADLVAQSKQARDDLEKMFEEAHQSHEKENAWD